MLNLRIRLRIQTQVLIGEYFHGSWATIVIALSTGRYCKRIMQTLKKILRRNTINDDKV